MKIKKYLLVLSLTSVFILNSVNAASDMESGVQDLAKQISKNMIDNSKKKIAVVEFSNLDRTVTIFGKYLAEELITNLFIISPGQFEVVERSQLDKVIAEHKLSASGLLDAGAMNTIGKILGVDAIVTGSVTDLDSSVKINARLVSISTAKVFAVAATSIPKIGTVAKLMERQLNTKNSIKTANITKLKKQGNKLRSIAILENGLSFDLDKCVRKNTQINCFITLKAVENDNVITVFGNKTIVYDDVGTARAASSTDIGGTANRRRLTRTLIAGIPNKLKLQFDGVSAAAKKVALLSIKYRSGNNNQSDVAEFRDVTLR